MHKGRETENAHSRRPLKLGERGSSVIVDARYAHRVDIVENARGRHHPAGVQVAAVVLDVIADDLALALVARAPRQGDRVAGGVHYPRLARVLRQRRHVGCPMEAGAGADGQVRRPGGVAGLRRGDASVQAGVVGVQVVDGQRAVDGHRDAAARSHEHTFLVPVNPRRGCTDRTARQRGDALQRQGLIRRAQLDYGRWSLLDGRHLFHRDKDFIPSLSAELIESAG